MVSVNPLSPQPAPALALQRPVDLDWILAGVGQVMAAECDVNRFIAPICALLWGRLLRMSERFAALFALWREGRLPASHPPDPRKPHARKPHARKPPKPAAAATEPNPALPRAFGWLLQLVPQADVFGTLLQSLLTDPEMVAFLAEAPQAGRLLRPLCRTLGVKPIPQMLRPKNPKPATPAPEAASPESPPREPPTTEPTATKPPPARAKKPDPCASDTHAGDPIWARPVSLWSKPPRPRN